MNQGIEVVFIECTHCELCDAKYKVCTLHQGCVNLGIEVVFRECTHCELCDAKCIGCTLHEPRDRGGIQRVHLL